MGAGWRRFTEQVRSSGGRNTRCAESPRRRPEPPPAHTVLCRLQTRAANFIFELLKCRGIWCGPGGTCDGARASVASAPIESSPPTVAGPDASALPPGSSKAAAPQQCACVGPTCDVVICVCRQRGRRALQGRAAIPCVRVSSCPCFGFSRARRVPPRSQHLVQPAVWLAAGRQKNYSLGHPADFAGALFSQTMTVTRLGPGSASGGVPEAEHRLAASDALPPHLPLTPSLLPLSGPPEVAPRGGQGLPGDAQLSERADAARGRGV